MTFGASAYISDSGQSIIEGKYVVFAGTEVAYF